MVERAAVFLATVTIGCEVGEEDYIVQKKGKGPNKRSAELAACKMVLKAIDNYKESSCNMLGS